MWLWQRGFWPQRSPARLKTARQGAPRLAEKAGRGLVPRHTLEVLPLFPEQGEPRCQLCNQPGPAHTERTRWSLRARKIIVVPAWAAEPPCVPEEEGRSGRMTAAQTPRTGLPSLQGPHGVQHLRAALGTAEAPVSNTGNSLMS